MIRKRKCEKEYIKNTTTHILTGQRLTYKNPPINLDIGDVVPIKIIEKTGIRDANGNSEVDPVFETTDNKDSDIKVEIIQIYEKHFSDLDIYDIEGISPLIKNHYMLCMYLALIYDCTMQEISENYVTIVKTKNI